jgi:hypothetical protein
MSLFFVLIPCGGLIGIFLQKIEICSMEPTQFLNISSLNVNATIARRLL